MLIGDTSDFSISGGKFSSVEPALTPSDEILALFCRGGERCVEQGSDWKVGYSFIVGFEIETTGIRDQTTR